MWSPTDSRAGASAAARKALGRLALAFCVMVLAGCGYGFGNEGPSVLATPEGGGQPTLKFKSVENPSLYPWLSYVVRTEMRDEIADRKLATWVDSGKADYEMTIKVNSFTFRSWITDTDDATTLYSASMTLDATVYRGNSNEVVWRSGPIGYSQSYETVQERTAASDLTRELARRLGSAMRQAF